MIGDRERAPDHPYGPGSTDLLRSTPTGNNLKFTFIDSRVLLADGDLASRKGDKFDSRARGGDFAARLAVT
jgi:hypothetical protein